MSVARSVKGRIRRHVPAALTLARSARDFYACRPSRFEGIRSECLRTADEMRSRPAALLQDEHEQQARLAGYPARPDMVIEINNTCNIDCLMCKTSLSTRRKGTMKPEVLDTAARQAREQGVRVVELHTIGDPLANPRLRDVLQTLRRYGLRTGLTTNGLLLYRHVETLLEFRDVCANIWFSIDGATAPVYESIRAGGKWEQLLENLDLARTRLRSGGFELQIGMTVSADNLSEVGLFIERFRDYVIAPSRRLHFAFVNSLSPDNQYFNRTNLFPGLTVLNAPCRQVSRPGPYVHIDGHVSVCCRDYDGSLVIGSLLEKPLGEIFTDGPLRELQGAHRSHDVAAYPLCSTCFHVDGRLNLVFNGLLSYLVYRHPDQSAAFYQERVDGFVKMFQKGDWSDYGSLFG